MLSQRNIIKFPDFYVSGTAYEFGVSKSALYTVSGFFKTILDQSPDIGSCKVEIGVSDVAVELALRKIHNLDSEIKNEDIFDCLQLAFKWDIKSLKETLIPRQIKNLDPTGVIKVLGLAQKYECTDLIKACGLIATPDGTGSNLSIGVIQGSMSNISKEMNDKYLLLKNEISVLEQKNAAQYKETKEALVALERKMDKILSLLENVEEAKVKAKEEKKGKAKLDDKEKWSKSTIMNMEQYRLLKEWIKPEETAKIQLILVYRGSRDSYTVSAFHSKCDNISPTITVVQSHLGKIFGGFTLVAWSSPSSVTQGSDPKAFTFSLTNKIKCCIKCPDYYRYAVCSCKDYGPYFGCREFYIGNECNLNKGSSAKAGRHYSVPSNIIDLDNFYAGSPNFSVHEIEVYRIEITYNYKKKKT